MKAAQYKLSPVKQENIRGAGRGDVWLMLFVGGSEVIHSMMLSIDETKQIFKSIERAYDDQDWWRLSLAICHGGRTVAPVESRRSRGLFQTCETREDVRRQDVATAIANFRSLL